MTLRANIFSKCLIMEVKFTQSSVLGFNFKELVCVFVKSHIAFESY